MIKRILKILTLIKITIILIKHKCKIITIKIMTPMSKFMKLPKSEILFIKNILRFT